MHTRQEIVPIIMYPGRKLEYIEPIFDMLREFKKQLNYARYVFVIGYSFKDDHLAKVCMCSCCNLEYPDSTTNIINCSYIKIKPD
jgi:hypothetical protein